MPKLTYLPGAQPQQPPSGSARVMQVIVTDLTERGAGTEADPVRRITQIWGLDGTLVAEIDPKPRTEGAVQ